jgi:NhaA family Na+:H+ antiporter
MADPSHGRRAVVDALKEFLHDEAVGGILLLAATTVALTWANFPGTHSYYTWWHRTLTLGAGSHSVSEDLVGWVNDGLMTVFFFVASLELKRELVVGELRNPRAAALPAVAAAGGAVLPAALFLLIASGGDAAQGWGIPMATDIAFATGVLALLSSRASSGVKLFLLSLALIDDLIAIVVIAVFYSEHIAGSWVAVVLGGLIVVVLMRPFVRSPWLYLLPGIVVWLGMLESGIHATVAGVLLGLLTPARPVRGRPVLEELEHRLHPVSVYVIVPIFALANAGVDLRGGLLGDALGTRLTWAIAIGLVLGKTLGITGSTLLMIRFRAGTLPTGMCRREVWPVAALGGIGFTIALFITDLAFADPLLISEAKVGVFLGSIGAAMLGTVLLWTAGRSAAPTAIAADLDAPEAA